MIKRDYATSIVEKFFPAATLEEKLRMINGLVSGSQQRNNSLSSCPETIVKAIKSLDQENCDSFPALAELADQAQSQIDAAKSRGNMANSNSTQ